MAEGIVLSSVVSPPNHLSKEVILSLSKDVILSLSKDRTCK
jgi:hypothetical protein